jgi:exonuclease SbcD
MRFMHIADIHLGYQQYGSGERFDDFGHVFLHIVQQAIDRDIDFLLLAGDLFEKRTVDPLAMRVAVEGFRRLGKADIPVVAVEGNHEKAYYRDQYSWLDFLDGLGYLHLLNPGFGEGRAILEPYGEEGGAYLDLPGGVRVYGIKYYGASTGKVFGLFAEALGEIDDGDVQFTILVAHAGLEGQLPRYSGTLTHNDLAPLREQIDYLALGHIHKPYSIDGWIYNPGSAETWSIEETAWPERGYFLVDIQPGDNPNHQAQLLIPPRRPFHRSRLEVDALTEPNSLYDAVRKLLQRESNRVPREPAPVVELTLSGILPFNRLDLDLDFVKALVEEAWSPLITRIQNRTTPADFEVAVDVEASRPELERAIVRELLERDARYRPAAEEWAQVALDVKRLALEGSTPETVIDHLRRARAELLIGVEGGL